MKEEEEQRMREGKELMSIPTMMTMLVHNNKESGKNANDAVWRKKSGAGSCRVGKKKNADATNGAAKRKERKGRNGGKGLKNSGKGSKSNGDKRRKGEEGKKRKKGGEGGEERVRKRDEGQEKLIISQLFHLPLPPHSNNNSSN